MAVRLRLLILLLYVFDDTGLDARISKQFPQSVVASFAEGCCIKPNVGLLLNLSSLCWYLANSLYWLSIYCNLRRFLMLSDYCFWTA